MRFSFTDDEIAALTNRIQFGGDEVVKQKGKGAGGSATVSTAYAAAEFVNGVMAAEAGKGHVVFCAYVDSTEFPDTDFFASPILFGEDGVEEVFCTGLTLSDFEQRMFNSMIGALQSQIAKGKNF